MPDEEAVCRDCGTAWTHPDAVWRPPPPNYHPCECGPRGHVSPEDREKAQHGIGRHHYRLWSRADAEGQGAGIRERLG